MKGKSIFRRPVPLAVIAFLLVPLLTGCVDLSVQAFYDEYWVITDPYVLVSCVGTLGGEFGGLVERTGPGHYQMDLVELGANLFEIGYDCEVSNLDCCGTAFITPVPMIYPVTLGCGKYNTCGQPY